jgi:hypothetical protein
MLILMTVDCGCFGRGENSTVDRKRLAIRSLAAPTRPEISESG